MTTQLYVIKEACTSRSPEYVEIRDAIPPTLPTRYLSSPAALDLPCENPTGGWHMSGTFADGEQLRFFAGNGDGCDVDTLPVLEALGIVDGSADAAAYGI